LGRRLQPPRHHRAIDYFSLEQGVQLIYPDQFGHGVALRIIFDGSRLITEPVFYLQVLVVAFVRDGP